MKKIYTVLFFVFFTSLTHAQDAFITQWQTLPSDASEIPLRHHSYPSRMKPMITMWIGEMETIRPTKAVMPHMSMTSSGTKTVTITGTFPRIYLNNGSEVIQNSLHRPMGNRYMDLHGSSFLRRRKSCHDSYGQPRPVSGDFHERDV